MKLRVNFWIIALLFLFFHLGFILSFASASDIGFQAGSFNQSFPGPDLFYPVTDDIDLKGSRYLEFKWRRTDFAYTRTYDFRLYKTRQPIAANLIFKEIIKVEEEYPYRIQSGEFQEGQVYTWVLIQVLNNGRKSDKSFGSFKIMKK